MPSMTTGTVIRFKAQTATRSLGVGPLVINDHALLRRVNSLEDEEKKLRAKNYEVNALDWILIHDHKWAEEDIEGAYGYVARLAELYAFIRLYLDREAGIAPSAFRLDDIGLQVGESFDTTQNPSALANIPDLWKLYEARYTDHLLSFDLFNKAHTNDPPPSEVVLFLVIALEGVLLRGATTELSYKFSLHGGHLLGTNKDEIVEYFEFFRQAYNYRSAIVHANSSELRKTLKKIGSAYGFKIKLEETTQAVLRILVEQPERIRDIESKVLS